MCDCCKTLHFNVAAAPYTSFCSSHCQQVSGQLGSGTLWARLEIWTDSCRQPTGCGGNCVGSTQGCSPTQWPSCPSVWDTVSVERLPKRGWGITQSVNYLPWKQEDLSLIPRTHIKKVCVVHIYSPRLGRWRSLEPWGSLLSPPNWRKTPSERLCLQKAQWMMSWRTSAAVLSLPQE